MDSIDYLLVHIYILIWKTNSTNGQHLDVQLKTHMTGKQSLHERRRVWKLKWGKPQLLSLISCHVLSWPKTCTYSTHSHTPVSDRIESSTVCANPPIKIGCGYTNCVDDYRHVSGLSFCFAKYHQFECVELVPNKIGTTGTKTLYHFKYRNEVLSNNSCFKAMLY